MKEDLLSNLSISAIQSTQIIMLRVNSVGTTSACDPASIFACPQCGMHHLVYEISMVSTSASNFPKNLTGVLYDAPVSSVSRGPVEGFVCVSFTRDNLNCFRLI